MNESVFLKISAKAINAMPIRLFVSGLASRIGFDIDAIENIKTAISEACVLLFDSVEEGYVEITIDTDAKLDIHAKINNPVYGKKNDDNLPIEFSRMILESLCDKARIVSDSSGHTEEIYLSFTPGE